MTIGDPIRRVSTSGTFRHGFKFAGAMLKAMVHRFREILHAEPPLNPLHRVEVIFARIFLVFRPSSRIGVQGSLALLLSFSSFSFRSRELLLLGSVPFSLLSHRAAILRSLSLIPSLSLSSSLLVSLPPIYLRFSLSIARVFHHGQFRGHEVISHLREQRE